MTISVLVMSNLEDTEQFMKEVSSQTSLSQIKITKKNIQDEVITLMNRFKNDDESLEEVIAITSQGVPLSFGNINSMIFVDYYDQNTTQCNLNTLKKEEDLSNCDEEISNVIAFPYDFFSLLKEYKKKYKKISTKEQLHFFLKEYQEKTEDTQIMSIEENFSFDNIEKKEGKQYLECSYTIAQGIDAKASFVFELGTNTIVSQTFDIDL